MSKFKNLQNGYLILFILISILLQSCSSYYKLVDLDVDERRPYKGDTVTFSWKIKQPWKFVSVFFEGNETDQKRGTKRVVADTVKKFTLRVYTTEGREVKKYKNLLVKQPRIVRLSIPDTVYNDSVFHLSWSVRNAEYVSIKGLGNNLDLRGRHKMQLHNDTVIYFNIYGKNNVALNKQFPIKVLYKDTIDYPEFLVKNKQEQINYRFEGAGKAFVLPMRDSIPLKGRYTVNLDSSQDIRFILNRFGRPDTLSYSMDVVRPEFTHIKATNNMVKDQFGYIEWETIGADSVYIRPMNRYYAANDRITISPEQSRTFHLEIRKGKRVLAKRNVRVEVFERRYVKGEISIHQIKDNRKFYYDIVGVNLENYPESVGIKVIVVDDESNFVKNMAPPHGKDSLFKKYFKNIAATKFGRDKMLDFTVKEVHELQSDPYDISLNLDYSGSMFPYIHDLNQAAKTFIANKNPHDRLAITKFDHRIKTFDILSKDKDRLIETGNFNGMDKMGGFTALYAACDKATETISNSSNSKVMILFSDGYENASFQYNGYLATQPNAVANKLIDENIKLYTVGFGRGVNVGLLNTLSDLADGKFYYCNSPEQINQVFTELPYIIHNYYEITFKTDQLFKGKNKIKLRAFNNQDSVIELPRAFDLKKEVDLKKYESNQNIRNYYPSVLSNYKKPITSPQTGVVFDFDKSFIKSEYYKVLSKYVRYLKTHRGVEVLLAGHSDLKGTKKRCWGISEERIDNVKQYLIAQGISPDRITEKAYGKSNPIWQKEKYEWQARENRRVDIIFYQ